MAVRIDFYRAVSASIDTLTTAVDALTTAIEAGGEVVADGLEATLVSLGYISASDLHEQSLVEFVERIDEHIGLFGLAVHGWGLIPADQVADVADAAADVPEQAAPSTDADLVARWSDVLFASVRRAAAINGAFAWQTRFDLGGTRNDGDDEFATAAALTD